MQVYWGQRCALRDANYSETYTGAQDMENNVFGRGQKHDSHLYNAVDNDQQSHHPKWTTGGSVDAASGNYGYGL